MPSQGLCAWDCSSICMLVMCAATHYAIPWALYLGHPRPTRAAKQNSTSLRHPRGFVLGTSRWRPRYQMRACRSLRHPRGFVLGTSSGAVAIRRPLARYAIPGALYLGPREPRAGQRPEGPLATPPQGLCTWDRAPLHSRAARIAAHYAIPGALCLGLHLVSAESGGFHSSYAIPGALCLGPGDEPRRHKHFSRLAMPSQGFCTWNAARIKAKTKAKELIKEIFKT